MNILHAWECASRTGLQCDCMIVDDAMADIMARTAKLTAAELRRFGNWCLKAAEQKQQQESGKIFPAPTDG